jgi:hypothetical protein
MRNVRDFAWAMAALAFLFCFSQLARAATLDVKVLVISTGTAQEDQGLDLIDDMLNEVGVSYEVLDSSRQTLTAEFLSDGTHGRFNGVILTDSMLYFTGPGNYLNSGFRWKNGSCCTSMSAILTCANQCFRVTPPPALISKWSMISTTAWT